MDNEKGKPWVWDCICPDTMALTHIGKTSKEAGSAAMKSERNKCNRYNFLTNEYLFSGLAFETMGAKVPEAKRMCSLSGNKLAERTGYKRAFEFYVNVLVSLCRAVTPVRSKERFLLLLAWTKSFTFWKFEFVRICLFLLFLYTFVSLKAQ